jgi:hypothetical protein
VQVTVSYLWVGQRLQQHVDCAFQWRTLCLAEPLCTGADEPRRCCRHERVAAEVLSTAHTAGLLSCQLGKQFVQASVGGCSILASVLLIWLQRLVLKRTRHRILSWHPACSWAWWHNEQQQAPNLPSGADLKVQCGMFT